MDFRNLMGGSDTSSVQNDKQLLARRYDEIYV